VVDAIDSGAGGSKSQPENEILKLKGDGRSWRAMDDEVVVLDTSRSEYLAVNKTGAALWPLLVAGATRNELANVLVSTFGVSESRATSDVAAFVAGLAERGMLHQE
jgi:hypothetical protein